MKKITLTILIALSVSFGLNARICSTVCDGNWNNASTWCAGGAPACGDTIVICSGHTCTVSTQQNFSACPTPMFIIINGQLEFDPGNKISLPTGSTVTVNSGSCIDPGNGGGSSNLITIGTTDVWATQVGTLCGYVVLSESTPLPVELIAFEAEVLDGKVALNWTTASETNNDFFTIQRTLDCGEFEDIQVIDGAGISTYLLSYRSMDEHPHKGISYYRLKQTDFNGNSTASSIVVVKLDEEPVFSFDILMNPGDGSNLIIETGLKEGREAQLVINDAKGNRVYSGKIISGQTGSSRNDLYLPQQLQPGIYVVSLMCETETVCKKMIVQ